jgi:CDP-glucose 4,6-dehydratase
MDLKLGSRLRELPGSVLVTGHTGFKGTWLTFLLERLGVPVVGFSLAPEPNSLFDRANRTGAIPETFSDIRDFSAVLEFMSIHRPSAVIHMAAQPLVLESYKSPRLTFDTNVMGTVNTLDSAFKTDSVEAIVVVTTDKVYRNDNSGHAFVESDALAGKDPYSASKVGTEAAVAAWQQISKISGGPKVISVRAGNVIGGGDWAENRLIPDLIRGFISGEAIHIRNPNSTRPWQHVLDPLSGYLMALEVALRGEEISAFNFGPNSESLPVRKVVELALEKWPKVTGGNFLAALPPENLEAESLHLDSNYASRILGWKPSWEQSAAVVASIKWWDEVLNHTVEIEDACQADLNHLINVLIENQH